LAAVVAVLVIIFFKELVYTTFDEESAKVSGIPAGFINIILIVLTAFTVSLSISIVGVLLISALIVLPAVTALQLRQSFIRTIICAEALSVFSVVAGIFTSFYFDLSTGGTIVLIMVVLFALVFCLKSLGRR
jgi:zinc transport system permease protein